MVVSISLIFTVDRFPTQEAAQQLRELLEARGFSDVEIAQLAQLVPEEAHEAEMLIPSLAAAGRDESELVDMLDKIVALSQLH